MEVLSDDFGLIWLKESGSSMEKKNLKLSYSISPVGIVKPFLWDMDTHRHTYPHPQSYACRNQHFSARIQLLKGELLLPIVDSV